MKAKTKIKIEEGKVLDSILQKNAAQVRHMDVQANILLGLCSALFIFSVNAVRSDGLNLSLITLALFCGLGALVALYSIHPPKRMRKHGQKESLFSKGINQADSANDYSKKLKGMLQSGEKVLEQYALEIYNIDNFYYRPKRKLFNYSRNILLVGISLSLLFFLFRILK